jgi:hypothetical protein
MRFGKLAWALLAPALLFGADAIQVPVWGPDGLDADSITASIGGEPTEVLGVRLPSDDLMLLVVLDLTGDLANVEQARQALLERLDSLPVNHFVGVMSAQNGLRVLAEPTNDRSAIAAAIRSQKVGGVPGLLDTVEQVARMASAIIEKSGVRVAVLYVTDSNVSEYRESFNNPTVNRSDNGDVSRRMDSLVRERMSRMAGALARTQAPVFVTHLTFRNDQLNMAYQTGLISVAAATGGTALVARSIAEIPSAVNTTLDQILNHYSVRLAVHNQKLKKADVSLVSRAGSLDYRTSYLLDK